jgi:hypothetical protein
VIPEATSAAAGELDSRSSFFSGDGSRELVSLCCALCSL